MKFEKSLSSLSISDLNVILEKIDIQIELVKRSVHGSPTVLQKEKIEYYRINAAFVQNELNSKILEYDIDITYNGKK